MNELVIFARKLYTPQGKEAVCGCQMPAVNRYDNAYVIVENGIIREVTSQEPKSALMKIETDLLLPGIVDCHTHIPFYGFRENDFFRRIQGKSYDEIHRSGGGIYETVQKVRNASLAELVRFNLKWMLHLFSLGVTTIEGKSGYGLSWEHESKQIKALKILSRITPVDIVTTFMGAHAVPPAMSKESYIKELVKMLDLIKDSCSFVDIFCESGIFEVTDAEYYLSEAVKKGFKIRLHAEEIKHTGATQLAVKLGAISADHLLKIDENDIKALSQSETIAVLMPSTSFYLGEKFAPARDLIEAGAKVAIASDFNPGSSAVADPYFVMHLAARYLKMSPYEILTAFTLNAAAVLGIADTCGTVEPGKNADMICFKDADLLTLPYMIGIKPVEIIKKGRRFAN